MALIPCSESKHYPEISFVFEQRRVNIGGRRAACHSQFVRMPRLISGGLSSAAEE